MFHVLDVHESIVDVELEYVGVIILLGEGNEVASKLTERAMSRS